MSNNNNNPPGKCLVKNHINYGNIYLNTTKYNKYYIKTKNNDIVNSYDIPNEYNASNLTLKDALSIIDSKNISINNDTPKIEVNNDEIKGKHLGKIGNEKLFLNFSKYNNKYYLKLTNSKDNIPIPKDIDVEKLTFDDAKNIVDFHMLYNNKVIGSRDDKDVMLKNGKFGLYIIWNQLLFTLPKFALEKIDKLDMKTCNYIIDYQLKIKSNSTSSTTNEDINITDDNNIVDNVLQQSKKSFLEVAKSNN
jgi:topoisomerase IA-like protein